MTGGVYHAHHARRVVPGSRPDPRFPPAIGRGKPGGGRGVACRSGPVYDSRVGRTLAIMVTMTTYGTWLRGDKRGWVEQGIIMPPDPALETRDSNRMKHPPFRFAHNDLMPVGEMIGRSLIERMDATILALTVQTWHVHFIVAAIEHDIGAVVKCAKDAARYGLRPGRPIWTDGYDKRFCFSLAMVEKRVRYVEAHNTSHDWSPRPWRFIVPLNEWAAWSM